MKPILKSGEINISVLDATVTVVDNHLTHFLYFWDAVVRLTNS